MLRNKKYEIAEITTVVFLMLLTFFLRIASLDYIDASDNYEEAAYKNLYQNGFSCYKYSLITTKLSLLLIEKFGFELPVLRIPSIFYSMVTVIFIYLLVRKINKISAIISIFLFAISPWAIALSRMTRDYAFDCMISSIVLYLLNSIISRKYSKEPKDYILDLLSYVFIILFIYFLTIFNNRVQTNIVIVFSAVAILLSVYYISKKCIKKSIILYSCLALFAIGFFIIFYFSSYSNFVTGISLNKIFFHMYFTSTVKSPWQWFHKVSMPGFQLFYFVLFLFPLFFVYRNEKKLIPNFQFLYLSFFFGLGLFVFKFKSHIHYIPTRYVYFLFPIYTILYSLSFYYLVNSISKRKIIKLGVSLIFFIVFLKLLNFGNLVYAVYPKKAYNDLGKSTIFIDNIGVGRFEMEKVVEYIKKDLFWSKDQVYVFGSRYAEFLLFFDYKMDNKRCLKIDHQTFYDVGVNMYVESDYWNQHELENAIKMHKIGYFITQDKYLKDSLKRVIFFELPEEDFTLYGSNFKFIKTINNYKIYSWERLDNK